MNQVFIMLLIIFILLFFVFFVIWRLLKNHRENKIREIKKKEKRTGINMKKEGFQLRFVNFNTTNFDYNGHIAWYKRFIEIFALGTIIFSTISVIVTILIILDLI